MKGHIYFAQMATGAIKIGFTTDLDKRHSNLSHGCPGGVTILTSFFGTPGAEAWLHRTFAAHRISGEWFEPTDDLLELINSARDIGNEIVPTEYRADGIEKRVALFQDEEIAERARFYLYRLAEPVRAGEHICSQIKR